MLVLKLRATNRALWWQGFELPQLTTAVDDCKNVENIFISQIEFRQARTEDEIG